MLLSVIYFSRLPFYRSSLHRLSIKHTNCYNFFRTMISLKRTIIQIKHVIQAKTSYEIRIYNTVIILSNYLIWNKILSKLLALEDRISFNLLKLKFEVWLLIAYQWSLIKCNTEWLVSDAKYWWTCGWPLRRFFGRFYHATWCIGSAIRDKT